jgi:hypothetical protein
MDPLLFPTPQEELYTSLLLHFDRRSSRASAAQEKSGGAAPRELLPFAICHLPFAFLLAPPPCAKLKVNLPLKCLPRMGGRAVGDTGSPCW